MEYENDKRIEIYVKDRKDQKSKNSQLGLLIFSFYFDIDYMI